MPGRIWISCCTCVAVVAGSSVNRNDDLASASLKPHANKASEGCATPAAHAAPMEAANPALSSPNNKASGSALGKMKEALAGRRESAGNCDDGWGDGLGPVAMAVGI